MRTSLLLFLLITASARAQLVNGSFESGGVFSTAGWEWTCDPPTAVHNAPPNAGEWSARKNMGDPNCSPSYLFQRIPFVPNGEHWVVSGWVRVDSVGWDAFAHMGFSYVSNGNFALQNQIGTIAPYWSYVWVTDTVHSSATDTAVVLLSSGNGFMGSGWFDGLDLAPLSTGINEASIRIHTYLDADDVLHLAAGEHAIRSVRLFDAAGRTLPASMQPAAQGSVAISTTGLKVGVYTLWVDTDAGPATARFVKP